MNVSLLHFRWSHMHKEQWTNNKQEIAVAQHWQTMQSFNETEHAQRFGNLTVWMYCCARIEKGWTEKQTVEERLLHPLSFECCSVQIKHYAVSDDATEIRQKCIMKQWKMFNQPALPKSLLFSHEFMENRNIIIMYLQNNTHYSPVVRLDQWYSSYV